MSNEEPNVHSMQADIRLLQQGQQHIQHAVNGMSNKLDGVVDALTTLVRLTEKHDALSKRVDSLERSSDERSDIANRGRTFIYIATVVIPLFFSALVWLGNQTFEIKEKLSKHETHYEDHR